MNLHEMCVQNQYDTDKYYQRYQWHSYVEHFYNDKFAPLQFSAKNILEIGILRGGSLQLWQDYFKEAMIYAVDNDRVILDISSDRFCQIKANAYTENFLDFLPNDYFDIIIDDGPHTIESQMFFVKHYFSKVKGGGFLICEDIASKENLDLIIKEIPTECKKYEVINLTQIDNRYDSIIVSIEKQL